MDLVRFWFEGVNGPAMSVKGPKVSVTEPLPERTRLSKVTMPALAFTEPVSNSDDATMIVLMSVVLSTPHESVSATRILGSD